MNESAFAAGFTDGGATVVFSSDDEVLEGARRLVPTCTTLPRDDDLVV
jgi:hypothetical protein